MDEKLRGTVISSTFIFLSRITGLLRDMIFAMICGASWRTDAFFTAFSIPNTLRRIFAEGLASPAYVPIFVSARETGGQSKLKDAFSKTLFSSVFISSCVTLFGILFSPVIISIFAPGFTYEAKVLGTKFLMLTFPFLIFVTVSVVFGSLLNSLKIFSVPNLAFSFFNVSFIFFGVLFYFLNFDPLWGFAAGVLAGGIFQTLVQFPSLIKRDMGIKISLKLKNEYFDRIKKSLPPILFGGLIYQVNLMVSRAIASFLPVGSISYLWYSSRLFEFPLGIFVYSISTVSVPFMSSRKEDKGTLSWSMRSSIFITVPAAVGLCLIGDKIIDILFMRGHFSQRDVYETYKALFAYSVGLPFVGCSRVMTVYFQSKGKLNLPVIASAISFFVNVLFSVILMRFMGHQGIALSTSISSGVSLLYMVLKRDEKIDLGLLRVVIPSVAMGFFILLLRNWNFESDIFQKIIWLFTSIAGSIAVYILFFYILKRNV